jgi:hypothetical protein
VMLPSNGMIELRGVRRMSEMKLRQTGNRIKATSKWSTKAAPRAITYVAPNVARALLKLSFERASRIRLARTDQQLKHTTLTAEGVVDNTKGENQTMEKDPEEEKELAPACKSTILR